MKLKFAFSLLYLSIAAISGYAHLTGSYKNIFIYAADLFTMAPAAILDVVLPNIIPWRRVDGLGENAANFLFFLSALGQGVAVWAMIGALFDWKLRD